MKKCLITGGAGFIGTHLTKWLIDRNFEVSVLDNLSPQIHGPGFVYPEESNANFIHGDVLNPSDWLKALKDVDTIVHFAAETGTGQSMYEVKKYTDVNISGTSVMLDLLVNTEHKVKKVIIASSRAIYGEGKYTCQEHGVVYPDARIVRDMESGHFDPFCVICRTPLHHLATDENARISPISVYGITKQVQEQLVHTVCRSIGIDSVALRYQNVYGPGQSLKNPYTGIISIFSTQIRNGKDLFIFEDGLESRDFVYIDDVIKATVLAIDSTLSGQHSFNVGSGIATSVLEVAETLKKKLNSNVTLHVNGNFRIGDIRHNYADLSKIHDSLGFSADFNFEAGIEHFIQWVNGQQLDYSTYDLSVNELKAKGLLK